MRFLALHPGHGDTLASPEVDTLNRQIVVYPVVYYLPETRWGFGAAGFYNFRFPGETARSNPSLVQFTVSYTLNKQLLFTVPFELYRHNNAWKWKGEFSYFRYQYNFYGIGDETALENRETFRAEYPRFRLDFLRRFGRCFAGLRYRFDSFQFSGFKPGGLLAKGEYTGKNGGTISGMGLVFQLDTRNRIYHPTKGVYAECEAYVNHPRTGSDFRYNRFSVDVAAYAGIVKEHVIAVQCTTSTLLGDPIFYDLLYFGSPRIMRGYQDRRFIDKNMFVLQTEYRFPIWKRLQGTLFYSRGAVSGTYSGIFQTGWQSAYGAGIRFILNQKDRLRLRVDYGMTAGEGGAFYLTVNDAF